MPRLVRFCCSGYAVYSTAWVYTVLVHFCDVTMRVAKKLRARAARTSPGRAAPRSGVQSRSAFCTLLQEMILPQSAEERRAACARAEPTGAHSEEFHWNL